MRKLSIALAIAFSIFMAPSVYAEEPTLAGEVSLKGLLTNVKGNDAKFNEYSDLHDGLYGRAKLLYDTDAWWLKANASDIGYDTQNYQLDGGMWGILKSNAFYKEIPHNIGFGARSMFTGVGSGNLSLPPGVDPTDATTWPSSFNYSTERRQTGGSFSLDVIKPFFFNASATTEQRKGNRPAGVSLDSGNAQALELPAPVDYRTDILKTELGYAKKPLFLDLYFMYSEFDNKNEILNFDNFSLGTSDTLTLPPDNKYYKVGFKGAVKLPFDSKFSINTGWSQTTSHTNLLTADNLFGLTLTPATFNGKIATQNIDVALTSTPVDFLDGTIFYKYYNRDNRSDMTTQTDQLADVFVNRLFSYQKNEFGGELGFRLPLKFYLSTGYTHSVTNQPLDTLGSTNDDIYSIGLKWKGLNFMSIRTSYERLVRNSDFSQPADQSLANPFNPGINIDGARNLDLADKTRDTVKLNLDLYPTDFLSIGLGYKHKETNYKQLQFGLKSDRRDEITTNVDLMIGTYAQLFGYFDYGLTRRSEDQQDQSISTDALWNLKDKEKYYDFGAGTNIYLVPKKLTLRLQYDYSKSDGNADLTLSSDALNNPNGNALFGTGANNNNIDIPNWDDYTKKSVMAKLIYNVTKKITFAIGYAYEKFTFSDAQLDGYALIPTDGGAFLTGAYANQSYKANLYFASVSYKFW
jgi:MtrB/PioB family decaheme-associated outer membrane protein